MTESTFTVLMVGLLAIDGVLVPFTRWAMNKGRTYAVLALPTLLTAAAFIVLMTFAPRSDPYIGVLSVASMFVILYNRYYLFASDDQLCEGPIWPRIRDKIMSTMNEIDAEDVQAAVDHSTHADRFDV